MEPEPSEQHPAGMSRAAYQRASAATLALAAIGNTALHSWGASWASLAGEATPGLLLAVFAGPWIGGKLWDKAQRAARAARAKKGAPKRP